MAIEFERKPTTIRPVLILPDLDLQVGHQIGTYVDSLGLGPSVGVTLQLKPTPENPDAKNLLASGTDAQLDAVEHTLDFYQQAVVDSLYQERLRSALSKGTLFPKDQTKQ